MGAYHLLSPVALRNFTASRQRSTGMYVSGTIKVTSNNCTPVHIKRTQNFHRLIVPESATVFNSHTANHLPVNVVVDEISYHGSKFGTETTKSSVQKVFSNLGVHIQRTSGIYHHRLLQLAFGEHISECASSDTQESCTGETIKEAHNDQGLNAVCHCAGNDPDKEEKCRQDINRLTPIELNLPPASTPTET